MESLQDQFAFVRGASRARNRKQVRFALLIAFVIAILLWQTQWFSLRAGLWILLAGQIVTAAVLLTELNYRRTPEENQSSLAMMTWFDREERFVTISSAVESLFRVVGFAVLAFGFWNATHILWITLALGVVYPIFSYFGVARRNMRQIHATLAQQRHQLEHRTS